MIRNLLALAGLIALALLSAVTLQAQGYFDDNYENEEPPVREAVSIAGLDLASPDGVAQLEARINAAIDRVCPDDQTGSLIRTRSLRACREDAVASARPQVDRAVAAAEAHEQYARRGPPPGRWRQYGPPPADRYAARAPLPHGEQPVPPPPAPRLAPPPPPVATAPAAPPPGARLVRRTVTTTIVTTSTDAALPPQTWIVKKVIVKRAAAPAQSTKSAWKGKSGRSPAFARRAAVAGSWLPPVAWAASDGATVRAFRTGRLARWGLTDRDGLARSGYATVSGARWLGGCPCRSVQVVKYHGRKQIVVASGMRCLRGKHLVNRAV